MRGRLHRPSGGSGRGVVGFWRRFWRRAGLAARAAKSAVARVCAVEV